MENDAVSGHEEHLYMPTPKPFADLDCSVATKEDPYPGTFVVPVKLSNLLKLRLLNRDMAYGRVYKNFSGSSSARPCSFNQRSALGRLWRRHPGLRRALPPG